MGKNQQGSLAYKVSVLCAGVSLSALLVGCSSLGASSVEGHMSSPSAEAHFSGDEEHLWDGVDTNPTCPGTPGLVPVSDEHEDRVSGYLVPVIKDQGVMKYATGSVSTNDAGEPVAYMVAEGDTATAIAERFCIGYVPYLGWINSIRRDGVDELFVGDTLNLDRYKVASVGTQNGEVLENKPEVHLPPQG